MNKNNINLFFIKFNLLLNYMSSNIIQNQESELNIEGFEQIPAYIGNNISKTTSFSALNIGEKNVHNSIFTNLDNTQNILNNIKNGYKLKGDLKKIDPYFYNENPEGLCFPDTYLFSNNSQDIDILHKCSNKMHDVLSKYWNKRSSGLPFKNMYEMLILASIIEKETSNHAEKRMISGVFINRLNQKMRLQSDPTVIYGIKDFDGNIKKKDLSEKNLYNTYRINGLPITPICSPGLESIIAASKPLRTKNLYFVSNNRGEHMFSETYEQHLEYVNKYQRGKE